MQKPIQPRYCRAYQQKRDRAALAEIVDFMIGDAWTKTEFEKFEASLGKTFAALLDEYQPNEQV